MEFDEAATWNESQQVGLGKEFLAEVQKLLDTIANHPNRYPFVDGDVHEAMVHRFPYCIYYRCGKDRIVIIAVFHSSRDPLIWQGRKD